MRFLLTLARLLYLPLLTYVVYVAVRLSGTKPVSDLRGLHAVMGAAFLAGGCTVCYLMSILRHWEGFRTVPRIRSRFWLAATLLFYLVLADAAFRVHEKVGQWTILPEQAVFLLYGALLLAITGVHHRTLHRTYWLCLVAFAALAGAAILGDATETGEGVVTVAGRSVSYEQACETLSVLVLAAGFTSEAIHDLREAVRRGGPGAESGSPKP